MFIHAKFPDDVGEFIVAFSGMAVPVFFLTSGYFSAKSDRKKLKRSICHILSLICFAYIISFVRICVQDGFSFFALINQINDIIFSLKNLVLFFVFNVTKISGVAWFLFALLYCYIFNLIFYNLLKKQQCIFYLLATMGFFCGLIIKFVFPILNIGFYSINNFWVCGMLYFFAGKIIFYKREKFALIPNNIYAYL